MNSRSYFMTSLLVMVSLSGCSTFDCCHWWGRNTDGSSNLGKKPVPYQQGPVAGTYTTPGNAMTSAPVQQTIPPGTAPVVTTSPAQTYSPPPVEQNNPAVSLPSPPSPLQNSAPTPPGTSAQLDDRTRMPTNGTFPSNQLTTVSMTDLPENKPSIPSPALPNPQVTGPTLPGALRTDTSPMPLLLAPQGPSSQNNNMSNSIAPPTIAMPDISIPAIAKPTDISPPKVGVMGKNPSLNPGTTPPSLPALPTVPQFDGK